MAPSKSDDYDGYRRWLGISDKKRPPSHYELLAISLDEEDPEVIRATVEQRRSLVESKRGEGHDTVVSEILYRIGEAEATLLNADMRRDYDRQLLDSDLFESNNNENSEMFEELDDTFEHGREQFDAGDFEAARKIFDSVYGLLRQKSNDKRVWGEVRDKIRNAKATCLYFLGLSCIEIGLVQDGMSHLAKVEAMNCHDEIHIDDDDLFFRMQTIADKFIESKQWHDARYCLQLALKSGNGFSNDHRVFELYTQACEKTNWCHEAANWIISLIEKIEEGDFYLELLESPKQCSDWCGDVLYPLLGKLCYRVGRSKDCLDCFSIARSYSQRAWGRSGLEHWIATAHTGIESKCWLFKSSDSSDVANWEQKRDTFFGDIEKDGLGNELDDFFGIGKSFVSMGQHYTKRLSQPEFYDDPEFMNAAKTNYEKALLHFRLAVTILDEHGTDWEQRIYPEALYWCGRAALEAGEFGVAVECLERMSRNWWNPDCEEWLEKARNPVSK